LDGAVLAVKVDVVVVEASRFHAAGRCAMKTVIHTNTSMRGDMTLVQRPICLFVRFLFYFLSIENTATVSFLFAECEVKRKKKVVFP